MLERKCEEVKGKETREVTKEYTATMVTIIEITGKILAKIKTDKNISLAYLHGSYATGKADGESDLDIAILAVSGLSAVERSSLRLSIMTQFLQVLGNNAPELDLTILQDTPILLQYNVIRRGTCIYERNRQERIEYELSVERDYEDECPMLDQESDIILQRILSKSR
ncbi:hypothetical protein EXS65_03665 [Candidatus Peribacteria bacterium]|nr:hypothetical protein [Candidatus Peribacteria bacterium]